jgi:hypothetical protein
MTSKATRGTTAAQEILLAAFDLHRAGNREFSEWQLTVAAWRRNKNRFGMRGYEDDHPDHKRVMVELMGRSKQTNPMRRKFLERTRTNFYRLTELGEAEAVILEERRGTDEATPKSPAIIYDSISRYFESRPFRAWCNNPEEPRTWLGASSFLGLASNTSMELKDRIRAAETAVRQATDWCRTAGRDSLSRGPDGGGRPIPLSEIQRIRDFIDVLQERFGRQMAAIRAKK